MGKKKRESTTGVPRRLPADVPAVCIGGGLIAIRDFEVDFTSTKRTRLQFTSIGVSIDRSRMYRYAPLTATFGGRVRFVEVKSSWKR